MPWKKTTKKLLECLKKYIVFRLNHMDKRLHVNQTYIYNNYFILPSIVSSYNEIILVQVLPSARQLMKLLGHSTWEIVQKRRLWIQIASNITVKMLIIILMYMKYITQPLFVVMVLNVYGEYQYQTIPYAQSMSVAKTQILFA